MRRLLSQAGGLAVAFALGFWAATLTDFDASAAPAEGTDAKPAYVIVSAKVPHPDKLGPYREGSRRKREWKCLRPATAVLRSVFWKAIGPSRVA